MERNSAVEGNRTSKGAAIMPFNSSATGVHMNHPHALPPEIPRLSQPMSPPVPFGPGYWTGFRPSRNNMSNMHSDMSTPDSSYSPVSLHFPLHSGHSSSTVSLDSVCQVSQAGLTIRVFQGPLTSSTTTPPSSTSSFIHGNDVPSHREVLHQRLSDITNSLHQNFIHETPNVPKQKPDKSQRACMSCYKSNMKCSDSDPYRCKRCLESNFYCKGPITTPELVALEPMYEEATLALRHQNRFLLPMSESFTVSLSIQPLPNATAMSSDQSFEFTIPGVDKDYRLATIALSFDDLLDALVALEQTPSLGRNPLYDLSLFKRLCRRTCHCITILRCLDRCVLSSNDIAHPTATHLVIGFIYQLSRKAQSLFESAFEELRRCCLAKRSREHTLRQMFDLTDHLGEICKELGALRDTLVFGRHPALLNGFLLNADTTIAEITRIARGLRIEDFNFANRSTPLEFGGISVTQHFDSTTTMESSSQNPASCTSFLDILDCSKCPINFTQDHASSAPITYGAYEKHSRGQVGIHQYTHFNGYPAHSGTAASQTFQPCTSETETDPMNLNWEAEADARLRPEWSLDAASSTPVEPILESSFACNSNDVVTRPEPLVNFVLSQKETNGQKNSNIGPPASAANQTSSKRKRTHKKQCMTLSQPATVETKMNTDTCPESFGHHQSAADTNSIITRISRGLARFRRPNDLRGSRIFEADQNKASSMVTDPNDNNLMRHLNVPILKGRRVTWPSSQQSRNSVNAFVVALAIDDSAT